MIQEKRGMLNSLYPYLLVAPAVVLVSLVSVWPTIYSFYLSMTRFRAGRMEFVFLRNYRILLTSASFAESFSATVVFLLTYVLLTVLLSLIIAIILNRGMKLTSVYMTIIFIPWVLSEITSGVVWRWFFYQDYGVLQKLLGPLFDGKVLIIDPRGAMGIVIAASVWRSVSFGMLLLLAGLQTIPKDIYEAAGIDGADGITSFTRITWPLVFPTLMVTTVFMSIQAINNIGLFLAITEGGPGRSTEVLSLFMYREAIQYFNLGYGATISVILLGINGIMALFYIRFLKRENALAA
jgi:multiple sugar transport system permease protein